MLSHFWHNNGTMPLLFLSQETMSESLDIPESLVQMSVQDFEDIEADIESTLASLPHSALVPLETPEINVDDDV
jgi:hypothetical protein